MLLSLATQYLILDKLNWMCGVFLDKLNTHNFSRCMIDNVGTNDILDNFPKMGFTRNIQ